MEDSKVSVIIPAKNEEKAIGNVLDRILALGNWHQVIVVDDGSIDQTGNEARKRGVKVVSHPYAMGNGAAVRSGARNADGDILVFLDADGQHKPEDIPRLLEKLNSGYQMAVGARVGLKSQAGLHRAFANKIYNYIASWMTGAKILDLTSGFRAVRANIFKKFLYLLPNGFSYPTTITMCMFRMGYPVAYVPIFADRRIGVGHIRIFRDGIRFFLIVFKVGSLFSPIKVFFPVSIGVFIVGVGHYAYNYVNYGRFTNMSLLLFVVSIVVFLVGLISEQVTALMYKDSE